MLKNTFVMLDGIGTQREASLWRSGVETWEDFLANRAIKGISSARKNRVDTQLVSAKEKLERRDSAYFASALPKREMWRCLDEFGNSIAFLDIETTGVSMYSPVTVVGIFDGTRMHTLIKGRDLNTSNLKAILSSVDSIVTFNGASFDLPILRYQFPGSVPDVPHVDLKHPLRRLGLTGGLKRIERELGVERDRRVEYMTGEDAVYLWRLWERHGKGNALGLLLDYNAEDCKNLKFLASYAYRHLKSMTFDAVVGGCKG